MRRTLVITVSLILSVAASAVPARRGFHPYTQPDGSTLMVCLRGDEFCHWLEDASGKVLEKAADGFLRPTGRSPMSSGRVTLINQRRSVARASASASRHPTGTKHIPVLLVNFKDVKFTLSDPNGSFDNLLNQRGYSHGGATGSVADFYYENSRGRYLPVFDVYGPVDLPENMAYYGANDSDGWDVRPEIALKQAAELLDAEVDFSIYDSDGDGYVDMTLMYYAGYNEAERGPEDSIWPHQSNVRSRRYKFDGVYLSKYFCTSELQGNRGATMCGPGTTCHEFAHSLGLPDMYDTDYSDNGKAGGTYTYDVMADGVYNNNGNTPPYFNAEELLMLGWLDSLRTLPASGSFTIPEFSSEEPVAYRSPSSTDGEYFVYECRGSSRWDAHIPAPGVIVYHIDKSSRRISGAGTTAYNLWADWETTNAINANGSHPCGYIIPAGAQNYTPYTNPNNYYGSGSPTSGLNYSGNKFPFGTGTDTYFPVDWAGQAMPYGFASVKYSSEAGCAEISMEPSSAGSRYNHIFNPGGGRYVSGEEFALKLIEAAGNAPQAVSWYFDGEAVTASSVTLEKGSHTIQARLTFNSGKSQTVLLEITVD